MKKLKIFAVLFFLLCVITAFASCGDKLEAPTGVKVSEENEISWSPVEDAYRYLVQCKPEESGKGTELKTKDKKIAIADFELEEGWYEVRVKALSATSDENNSDWSEPFRYYKICYWQVPYRRCIKVRDKI